MDYDARFKSLLTNFFREFLELFVPEFAAQIDWRHPPVFLDKELQSIALESGPKTVDLLVKVWSKEAPRHGTQERLCLIHIEVEARRSRDALGKRVSHYINRIDEKFDLPVLPIAVYLNVRGDGIGWQTRELTCWGHTIVSYHFPYIGLPALDGAQFAESLNPVALALTGLMNVSPADRARIKAEALWRMEKLTLDRRQRSLLANSIEAFTVLDQQQRAEFDEFLKSPRFQKVRVMQKTIYEVAAEQAAEQAEKLGMKRGMKQGLEQGLEQGMEQGRRSLAERILKTRFGALPAKSRRRLEALSAEQFEQLAERIVSAETLADLGL